MESTKHIYFVLGGPGSGKGTFCSNIVKKNPTAFVHLSAGDLLRKFNKEHDPKKCTEAEAERFNTIDHCIKEGLIVPAHITISLILEEVNNSKHQHFLIDGFPRNQGNYDGWNSLSEKYPNIVVAKVLFLECSEETMLKRIYKRADESDEKRVDDNIDAFKKRIHTFVNETKPILELYEQDKMVLRIDSEKTQEEMYNYLVQSKVIPNLQ